MEAEGLFVAEYNPRIRHYEGTFHWLSKTSVDLQDCLAFRQYLDRYLNLAGWVGPVDEVDRLPLPVSATIGGLLICRNGDARITLAIMPNDLAPRVALTHIALALNTTLADVASHPEVFAMPTAHPMIDAAQASLQRICRPTRMIMLQACLNAIRRRELVLTGAAPGEEENFYSPDNQLQLVFLFAAKAFRDHPGDPVRYWTEWQDMEEVPPTFSHWVEQRLMRYLKRRRAILPDAQLGDPNSYAIPPGLVHAAWIIVWHPHEGLYTKLLVLRGIEVRVGLTFLEDAVRQAWLAQGGGDG